MTINRASVPALPHVPANYQSLLPIGLLFKAAQAFPNRTAVVHGQRSYDCAELDAATVASILNNTEHILLRAHGAF